MLNSNEVACGKPMTGWKDADLQGKTALVTGSTDGLGRPVAGHLARQGAHVLIHGRDAERGQALAETIRQAGGRAQFLAADLASLDEVRRLAAYVQRSAPQLDILINNAGIGPGAPGSPRSTSADDHELRFAVNYLAGFLLTRLLLPQLRASGSSRIVNVSSAGQQAIDFSDVMLEREYDGFRAYFQSKLAQVLFTIDLAEELRGTGISVNAVHPASFMDTNMVRQVGDPPQSSVEEGAEAVLNLAASPDMEGETGHYYDQLNEGRALEQAYDPEARARLRELSIELTGIGEEGGRGSAN